MRSVRLSRPVLAIDAALGGCIAAVIEPEGGQSYSHVLQTGRDQAAKLVPMVQELMGEAGIGFSDLGLIVTTIGPGSFTGLRIGMSTAKTFALALSLPIQGVTTFDVMVRSCAKEDDRNGYFVLLETKRADYYTQIFDRDFKPLSEPVCLEAVQVIEAASGKNLILCGDGIERLREEVEIESVFSGIRERFLLDPVVLASLGHQRFLDNGMAVGTLEPFYMRGADVSMSNKIQRQIDNFPE